MFGVWTTGQAFDPQYEAKQKAARQAAQESESVEEQTTGQQPPKKNALGRKEQSSEGKTVTEATLSVTGQPPADNNPESQPVCDADDERPDATHQVARPAEKLVDFAALRSQVSMQRALDALGLRLGLRGGRNSQYRGACPIHGEDPGSRKRSFSVNLNKGVFRCFYADCGAQGNVLDLWSAVRKLTLREAALEMIETFGLDTPTGTTEKRAGEVPASCAGLPLPGAAPPTPNVRFEPGGPWRGLSPPRGGGGFLLPPTGVLRNVCQDHPLAFAEVL